MLALLVRRITKTLSIVRSTNADNNPDEHSPGILHLKRFSNDGVKNCTPVSIPLDFSAGVLSYDGLTKKYKLKEIVDHQLLLRRFTLFCTKL